VDAGNVVGDVGSVLADARAKERLEHLGPGAFEEPLGVLLDSYAAAGLNEVGAFILRSGVVHSLRMRLRAQEWFRRYPEVADEVISAPVVVVGMMRSGTTLVQRLLAADDRLRCAYGWEVQQVAPRLDWDPAAPDPRIERALAREAQTKEHAPDLFAIHPMYALEAEEEIVFLADAFLSHVPESGADVAAYRQWLDTADFAPAYDHLHRMLQLLQWQKRRRGESAERWVLKTPAHLGYLDDLRRRFPDLHLVHLHRDPVETIPSGASLNATLHAMHADTVDRERIGRQWLARMGWTNDRAMATRDRWDAAGESGLVTDVQFEDAVNDPIDQMARVYDAAGLRLTAETEAAMRDWLQRRPRETGRPAYEPETYGLDEAMIRERFSAYDARFPRLGQR
jgi:Sulfotransferase family